MRLLRMAACSAAIWSLLPALAVADTTGFVSGVVTVQNKPEAGVTVSLVGEGTTLTTTSGPDGRFRFARVPFGHYTLRAPNRSRELDVTSDSVISVTLADDLREIGRTATASIRGPADTPVGANTLDKNAIATLPGNQSLNQLIQTVPGVARFSYNEPVAHGFHGLTYEIDGIPFPQGSAGAFSEIIDPRTIDSLEVFTGAFPAEYGGQRQGAVVNIITKRASDFTTPEFGTLTAGIGNYASAQGTLSESVGIGTTRLFVNTNTERTSRGIDSPTFDPIHDNSSQSNEFLRTITDLNKLDTLTFNASNNYSTYQVPINTTATANDPVLSVPGTDDVQNEYTSLFNVSYTHNAADGEGYVQVAPWYSYNRIVYQGDIPKDLQGTFDNGDGTFTQLAGLRQDRHSTFEGLRLVGFRVIGNNAIKAGIDGSIENFDGNALIVQAGQPNFFDVVAQRGTNLAAYIQDKWTPTPYVSVLGGLRADRSTGFVDGGQLSPRIEVNFQVDPYDVLHAYYGRLYSAPFLEDTRRAAIVTGTTSDAAPVYDLRPERDSYYEFGLAHELAPAARAYINFWKRDVTNVLDTTQIFPTPIFAVYNNTIGIAKGVEGRVDARFPWGDSMLFSTTLSSSEAGGISGGTFLFPPGSAGVTLQPEDHDQTFSANLAYTHTFGPKRAYFATLEPEYGTGYPVQFQNGTGRLPPHLLFDASVGSQAQKGHLGFDLTLQNITNDNYLLKINNGFNTTQYGAGRQVTFRITAPF